MNESHCKYVSSYGILKSTQVYSSTPISSITELYNYDFSKLLPNSSLYICNSAIPKFVSMFDVLVIHPIVLVSGDSDVSIPNDVFNSHEEFLSFIENPKIIHWFAQNTIGKHPKLSKIPIGLDYHTMSNYESHPWGPRTSPQTQEEILVQIKDASSHFEKRFPLIYSNCHFSINTRFASDRINAIESIPRELVFYEEAMHPRIDNWKTQSNFAFVLSPHGNGLDCHRTWEALCLGCIPIVKTSALDELYTNLPVLIVNSWDEVSSKLLETTISSFSQKSFNYEKLDLKYWVNRINFYTKK